MNPRPDEVNREPRQTRERELTLADFQRTLVASVKTVHRNMARHNQDWSRKEHILAFNAPVLTRRQRADRLKRQHVAFFKFFAPEAREILDELLEKYASDGVNQLQTLLYAV